MFSLGPLRRLLCVSVAITSCSAKLLWGDTKFLITFGDSYTTDGMWTTFTGLSFHLETTIQASTFLPELILLFPVS
jgi:hypothetical protein